MTKPFGQNGRSAGRRAAAAALSFQALAFWSVLLALSQGSVGVGAWLALHGLLALGLIALNTVPCAPARWPARTWLALAFYAVFFAAFFAGANFALDALHGAQRQRVEIAPQVGGLELWQVLCPGVFSFAIGALTYRLVTAVAPDTLDNG
jgi:hypothetical protein